MARYLVFTLSLVFLVAANLASPTKTAAATEPAAACAGLQKIDFGGTPDAPTEIVTTKMVDATTDSPAYCNAIGYVTPNIGFEIHLPPTNWNGKFTEVGCGGMCGSIQVIACDVAVAKGYSCIFTDMGHKSTAHDAGWAYNNLQAAVDFGYRATHVGALAGKAITEAYYKKAPNRSYFLGCSTGGRQGYIEAQRFPADFDGILAGAPPLSETGDGLGIMWGVLAALGPDGKAIIGPDELKIVNDAVVTQCDMNDGVKDGVVSDPRSCKFDPGTIVCKPGQHGNCLTGAQAEAFRKFYYGPHDSKGKSIYPGFMPGAELTMKNNYIADDGTMGYLGRWMQDMMRYLNLMPAPGPSWTLSKMDWDKDPQRLAMMEALYNAQNPNLEAFKATGGKFIAFHGWNDAYVQPMETVHYYEMLERTMGGRAETQDFFRLFMVPGTDHCQGGSGPFAVDWFGALEAWVEQGKAPDRLIGVHPKDPTAGLRTYNRGYTPAPDIMQNPAFTRPLFPYPLQAKYKGAGDPNDAANFDPQ
jgi:feruloyl esterase